MSGNGKQKIARMQSKYITEHELTEIAGAEKRKKLYRRLAAFGIIAGLFTFFIVSTLISQNSIIKAKQAEKVKLEQQLLALKKGKLSWKKKL